MRWQIDNNLRRVFKDENCQCVDITQTHSMGPEALCVCCDTLEIVWNGWPKVLVNIGVHSKSWHFDCKTNFRLSFYRLHRARIAHEIPNNHHRCRVHGVNHDKSVHINSSRMSSPIERRKSKNRWIDGAVSPPIRHGISWIEL